MYTNTRKDNIRNYFIEAGCFGLPTCTIRFLVYSAHLPIKGIFK